MNDKPEVKPKAEKPEADVKPAGKPVELDADVVTIVSPDGRPYRTTGREADRLIRTAGYTRK